MDTSPNYWKRWFSEHQLQLTNKPKWHTNGLSISGGNFFILKEDNVLQNKWLFVRIIKMMLSNGNVTG